MSKKITLTQTPDEDVYYDFEEETNFLDQYSERAVITGNNSFRSLGDKTLIDIINHDYYDDDFGYDYDIYEELKKVTGKEWDQVEMHGYSQSDWQGLYYVVDAVSKNEIKGITDFYMGKVKEFRVVEDDDAYIVYVPDDVVWQGKAAIAEYLGMNADDVVIKTISGSHTVYDYEELD